MQMATFLFSAERVSQILGAGYHSHFAAHQALTRVELLSDPLVKDWFAVFPLQMLTQNDFEILLSMQTPTPARAGFAHRV